MLRLLFNPGGNAIADQIAEFKNQLVGHTIVGQGALGATRQNPRLQHDLEVFRHIGLARLRGFYQVLHTFFAIPQQIENPQPHRLTEHTKVVGNLLYNFLRN